ncbi:MAG TPA: dienelactone hydrolase family protein [Granulicella sp.]
MGSLITVKAADGHELKAYVARPEGTPVGGLVVVQEIFGINAHVRSVADGYAKDGFLVVAPALFDRYERDLELGYTGEDKEKAYSIYPSLNFDWALLDVAAAFGEAKQAGKVGVVGFCWGGVVSWLTSTRGPSLGIEPAAAVVYYGGGIGKVAAENPTCPVMLHFGANDTHIGSDQIEAVRSAHPEAEIYLYEGAGHAFNRDVDPESYSPEAAKLARERSLAFFHKYIG